MNQFKQVGILLCFLLLLISDHRRNPFDTQSVTTITVEHWPEQDLSLLQLNSLRPDAYKPWVFTAIPTHSLRGAIAENELDRVKEVLIYGSDYLPQLLVDIDDVVFLIKISSLKIGSIHARVLDVPWLILTVAF